MHKMKMVKRFDFHHTKAHPQQSAISDEIHEAYLRSNDAIGVISATNSNSLVHKMKMVKRFDFQGYIAHSQSAISDEIPEACLRRNEHAILAMMLSV